MYEYFGSGDKENGETYLRQLYMTNKAIDLVYSKAIISEKAAELLPAVTEKYPMTVDYSAIVLGHRDLGA